MSEKKNTYASLALIGAACGWGAADRGTEKGPESLKAWGLAGKLGEAGVPVKWADMVTPAKRVDEARGLTRDQAFPLLLDHVQQLGACVAAHVQKGTLPVVIGGDHSIAMGTWSGATTALDACGEFGLIWIDAHMDAHTPETAHEGKWGGNYHGMPLAHLMGYGREDLRQIISSATKLSPQHVCLVGIRSYEPGEAALLEKLGVRVIHMSEVEENGIDWALDEALKVATQAPKGFGISIDLDGFDPEEAPGVGTPESPGIKVRQALPALGRIGGHAGLKAIEVVEYNPGRDSDHKTALVVENVLAAMLAAASKKERVA